MSENHDSSFVPSLITCHPGVSVPSGSAAFISTCLVILRCGHMTCMQVVSCSVVSRRSEGFQLALSLYLCVCCGASCRPVGHLSVTGV